MKKVLFLLACAFCAPAVNSQRIDSLKQALLNATHDTTRCAILNTMIELETNDELWPAYNEEMKNIAEKIFHVLLKDKN